MPDRRRGAAPAESRPVITTGVMPPRASSLRPWPSRRAEGLEGLALLADVDAAIGEHAVDVEDRDAHALRREQELRRELQHRVEGASAMDGAV